MRKLLPVLLSFFGLFANAYIPKVHTILEKTVDNSGSGIYLIEQEIHFQTRGEPFVLRESLWVYNEDTMKLVVTGTKDLKDQIKWTYLYQNGTRFSKTAGTIAKKKVTEDFIEKYFHFRKNENLGQALHAMRLIGNNSWIARTGRTAKDFEYRRDPNVRLARTGGVLAYAFGNPSTSVNRADPGMWIEQDVFVVRKFRLPSAVEVSADKFSSFSRGLTFPKSRTVRWENNQAQIQTIDVRWRGAKAEKFFSLASLENTNSENLPEIPAKPMVEEFYKRFR